LKGVLDPYIPILYSDFLHFGIKDKKFQELIISCLQLSIQPTKQEKRNNLLKMNSFRVFVFFFGTISTFGSAWQQPVMMTPAWTSSGMPTADQQMTPNNQDQLWRKVSLLTAHKP
jgi:hypothetical protein